MKAKSGLIYARMAGYAVGRLWVTMHNHAGGEYLSRSHTP